VERENVMCEYYGHPKYNEPGVSYLTRAALFEIIVVAWVPFYLTFQHEKGQAANICLAVF